MLTLMKLHARFRQRKCKGFNYGEARHFIAQGQTAPLPSVFVPVGFNFKLQRRFYIICSCKAAEYAAFFPFAAVPAAS